MFRFVLLGAALFLAVTLVPAGPADSSPAICGERADIANSLSRKYSEEPVSLGVNVDGGILEVFASTGGSWTIVVTDQHGRSCVLAAGEHWESFAPKEKPDGRPT